MVENLIRANPTATDFAIARMLPQMPDKGHHIRQARIRLAKQGVITGWGRQRSQLKAMHSPRKSEIEKLLSVKQAITEEGGIGGVRAAHLKIAEICTKVQMSFAELGTALDTLDRLTRDETRLLTLHSR